jgi:hypothetical protein
MRDGHTLPKPSRAELLAREQTVEHRAARDAEVVFKKKPHVFKDAFLAAGVEIKNDIFEGK